MAGKMSLVEQKRIQWARERDEMARLSGSWGFLRHNSNNVRTDVRSYQVDAAMSTAEIKDKQGNAERFRSVGHYGSSVSLKSLATESFENGIANIKRVDCNGDRLINLPGQLEMSQIRRRSPSLPPIHSKDHYFCQAQQNDFGIEGFRYNGHKLQVQGDDRCYQRYENRRKTTPYVSQSEEREGETSGYASDSADVPVAATGTLLPGCKPPGAGTNEKTWQNPYCTTPENSLPPSRRLSDGRIGELNRPRWDGVRGQDTFRGDPPPPPSWLSRLGHASQVLIINHDSASSSDSSTTDSTGSNNKINKTHLRGQNIPVDEDVLQERERRRQKALDLQNAIKQQLEEKERQRKEEKEKRLREEHLEEERIKRERERERERFEEEQKRLDEKGAADLKRAATMREVIEAAERLAKEEKKIRRKRNEAKDRDGDGAGNGNGDGAGDGDIPRSSRSSESKNFNGNRFDRHDGSAPICRDIGSSNEIAAPMGAKDQSREYDGCDDGETRAGNLGEPEENPKVIRVPISKDVAIVLSGRLAIEDSELVNNTANLGLVNFVLTSSPRRFEGGSNNLPTSLDTFLRNVTSAKLGRKTGLSPIIVENRLLTPSKYRTLNGRDFGTQTDLESDLQSHPRERVEDPTIKGTLIKERKDMSNVNRRDVEKCANAVPVEEIGLKSLSRSKSQPRTSIESRPRWNANRPGTRYRTQSEKDPHYQRRLRLRRRQVESSDERSRSPSPRRRNLSNVKPKCRVIVGEKAKLDSYDADLSMDSLNSIIPLRTDKNGRINIEDGNKFERKNDDARLADDDSVNESGNSNVWCGQEILSKLSSLRTGLLLKQMEWDSERCLVSPVESEMF